MEACEIDGGIWEPSPTRRAPWVAIIGEAALVLPLTALLSKEAFGASAEKASGFDGGGLVSWSPAPVSAVVTLGKSTLVLAVAEKEGALPVFLAEKHERHDKKVEQLQQHFFAIITAQLAQTSLWNGKTEIGK